MNTYVQAAFDGQICRLILNRPEKRNALSREFIAQLLDHVRASSQQAGLRLLTIQATGPAFCSGMDLEEMRLRAVAENCEQEWQEDARIYAELLTAIYQLPVPTVAVAQGPAIAGGMGLLLACDLVVASEQAFFALPEPARGITAAIVTPLLVHRVGAGPATQLLLSGMRWDAAHAMNVGLCLDVVKPNQLSARVDELTRAILQGARSALAITKKQLAACVGDHEVDRVAAQLQQAVQVSAEARRTDEAREGLDAFLHKRKPKWQS